MPLSRRPITAVIGAIATTGGIVTTDIITTTGVIATMGIVTTGARMLLDTTIITAVTGGITATGSARSISKIFASMQERRAKGGRFSPALDRTLRPDRVARRR